MKLLAILGLVAGGMLAIVVLRAVNGNWSEFGPLVVTAAGLNVVVGAIGYFVFRRSSPEVTYYKVGLALSYVAGIACGGYLYYH